MKLFNAVISQLTPMMMDRIDERALRGGSNGVTKADEGDPRAIAEHKIYRDLEGNIVVPTANLLRCFVDTGKWFKVGRKQVTTKDTTMVTACIGIDPVPYIPLTFRDPWEVDTRPIRMLTGIRLSDRPMFHDWSLSFTITLEDDLMGAKLLRDIVDAAGRRVGLGPFRPDRKGPFGRFAVTKWEEVELSSIKSAAERRAATSPPAAKKTAKKAKKKAKKGKAA